MRFLKTETEVIRFANKADIPKLKELWKICFGDTDETVNAFFEGAFSENTTLVLLEKGRAAAMLTMIPARLSSPLGEAFGYYVYAVATLPEFRGRGYMSLIEAECCKIASGNGARFCLLVPATEQLFGMYGKLGYKNFSAVSLTELLPSDKNITDITPISFEEFRNKRGEYLSGFRQSVRFEESFLKYAYFEYLRSGGVILGVKEGYVCGFTEKNIFNITETSLTQRALSAALHAVLRFTGAERAVLRAPGDKPYSMIKWLSLDEPFSMINANLEENFFGFALE